MADVAVKVTVRYFAAARAAAGFDDEIIGLAPGTTVGALVEHLGERDPELAKVLEPMLIPVRRNCGARLGDDA